MTKTIQLALRDFPIPLPFGLNASNGDPLEELSFEIDDIYAHYWLCKHGPGTPIGQFEFLDKISTTGDLRFKADGLGYGTEPKKNISNELAKGFARWFMYRFLDFTYFSPFEHLLNVRQRNGSTWTKRSTGDGPDYICGRAAWDVNVLEVKGRYDSVTFDTVEFQSFRDQVDRARLLDDCGNAIATKAYICAARWATESHPNVMAKLWIEDPWTPGMRDREPPRDAGIRMVLGHYAAVLQRMDLYSIANALLLDREPAPIFEGRRRIWRCERGPGRGRTFISMRPHHALQRPRRADLGSPVKPEPFFGIDIERFKALIHIARTREASLDGLEPLRRVEAHEGSELFRDGVVTGPSEYFWPIRSIDINTL